MNSIKEGHRRNLALKLPYKVPLSIVAERLPSFFKTYDTLNDVRPSSWIVWKDEDEKSVLFAKEACHANMTESVGFDNLITAMPNSDPISIAYQKMLLNGPFQAVSDMINIGYIPNKYYIHCTDLEKWPSNLLFNYCIATRVPIEHAELLPLWSELTLKGYDPTLAFLLSYTTRGSVDNSRSFPNLVHFWFDSASDWRRILKGDPTRLSRMYKTNPSDCTPCNVLWGKSQDYQEIMGLSDEEVSKFFDLPIEPYVKPEKPTINSTFKKLYGAPIGFHGVAPAEGDDVHLIHPGEAPAGIHPAFVQHHVGMAGAGPNPAAEILINPHPKWNILPAGGLDLNPNWQAWHDAHAQPNDPFNGIQFGNVAQQQPQPEVFHEDDDDEDFFDEDDGDLD